MKLKEGKNNDLIPKNGIRNENNSNSANENRILSHKSPSNFYKCKSAQISLRGKMQNGRSRKFGFPPKFIGNLKFTMYQNFQSNQMSPKSSSLKLTFQKSSKLLRKQTNHSLPNAGSNYIFVFLRVANPLEKYYLQK